MAKVETVTHVGSFGPSVYTETVKVETVKSGGVITANVSDAQRQYMNPETLPSGPIPMPRRRARR